MRKITQEKIAYAQHLMSLGVPLTAAARQAKTAPSTLHRQGIRSTHNSRIVSDAAIERAREAIADGVPFKEAATLAGCSESQLRYYGLRPKGVSLFNKSSIAPEKIKQAKILADDKYSILEIAKKLSMSPNTLRAYGIKPQADKRRRKESV